LNNGPKQKKIRELTPKSRTVLIWISVLFLLLFAGICIRLIYIINVKGRSYTQKVLAQQSLSVSYDIDYQRGSILDKNGLVLAQSNKSYRVILDPKVILTQGNTNEYLYYDTTVKVAAEVFGMTEDQIKNIINSNADSSYLVLKKDDEVFYQDYDTKSKFESYETTDKNGNNQTINGKEIDHRCVKGVWFEPYYSRTYPYSSLASNVLGFAINNDEGMNGIENYYNSYLTGTEGREYGYFDSELNEVTVTDAPVDGDTITTTIDANVQKLVEEHVTDFLSEYQCQDVGVIIMNPNNGAIYAMVSNKGFDLNKPNNLAGYYMGDMDSIKTDQEEAEAKYEMWRNFCVSDTYEPGSTFKPFTIAAALEENLVTPESTFMCNGYMMVGGWRINCNNKSGHGLVDLSGALEHSCNPALMQIGALLGADLFAKYQRQFGFGRKTGIDLPGEGTGLLYNASDLHETELATCSFGQSFNVTMIQMAAGFSSLINGGYYYKPHVVEKITNPDGVTVYEDGGTLLNKTVSEDTTDFIRNAMYATVMQGTATKAQVAGYTVGGKTGTAQKGIRSEHKYVVSFIGCVPYDDPQVVSYVVVDECNDPVLYNSSSLATNLTSQILGDILPYLGVYPEGGIDYDSFDAAAAEGDEKFDENGIVESDGTTESDNDTVSDSDNVTETGGGNTAEGGTDTTGGTDDTDTGTSQDTAGEDEVAAN
jgi:stage V sporulation protein D (sporulation-specific penicillin-binding protein)